MIEKLKKLKLRGILIFQGCISVSFEFILAALTFAAIASMTYFNANLMHFKEWNTDLLEIQQDIKEIKNDILESEITKQTNNVDNIKSNLKEIESFIDNSLTRKLTTAKGKELEQKQQAMKDRMIVSYANFESNVNAEIERVSNGEENNFDVNEFNKDVNELDSLFTEFRNEIAGFTEYETGNLKILVNVIKATHLTVAGLYLVFLISIIYIMCKIIKKASAEVIDAMKKVASGNLNLDIKIGENVNNEFEVMKKELVNTVESFKGMISAVSNSSGNVNERSKDLMEISHDLIENTKNITVAIDDVTAGASEQASDLVKINNTLEGFSDLIEGFLENVNAINGTSNQISNNANESNEKMDNLVKNFKYIEDTFALLVEKINALGSNITRINEITNLIDSIAEQTNLLALNAAIEAARAGEGGRGFAIVADEVRKLAEQSMNSASEITEVINEISTDTKGIVTASDDVSDRLKNSLLVIEESIISFGGIVTSIEEIVPKIEELTVASVNIGKEKEDIVNMIESASSIAEEVSASTEEIAASIKEVNELSKNVGGSSDDLKEVTGELENSITKFQI